MTVYTTVPDLAAALNIGDGNEDETLEAAIEAASRQIDDYCGRRFYQDATVVIRYYSPDDCVELLVDDISTTSGLIVALDDDTGTYATTLVRDTDFRVGPVNAAADDRPYTQLLALDTSWPVGYRRPAVKVTAKFGWATTPPQITRACLIQAKNLYKAPSGTLVGFQSAGLDAGVVRIPPLDPIAAALVQPFVKVAT